MTDEDWSSRSARTLGMFLSGRGIRTRGPRGERIVDDSFLVVLHPGDDVTSFRLPGAPWADGYVVELDTADPDAAPADVTAEESVKLAPRSLMLLRTT
jgi:glycogen operon protein